MTSYIVFGAICDGLLEMASSAEEDRLFLEEAMENLSNSDFSSSVFYCHPLLKTEFV